MESKKLLKIIKQNKVLQMHWLYLRCIRRFGLPYGNRTFNQLVKKDNEQLISLRLPGYDYPIIVRPKTSDVSIFETVFIALRFSNLTENIKPKLIIDAGANIGLVSIYYAKKFPSATIYSVEPESSNYEVLVKNTMGYKNVIPIQAALWKNNSPLHIENLDVEKWAFRVTERPAGNASLINALTINNILTMANKDFVDILKIDIEGAEKDLFEENYETWINKVGLIIIELHEGLRKGTRNSFYSAISKLKYHEFIEGENHYISVY